MPGSSFPSKYSSMAPPPGRNITHSFGQSEHIHGGNGIPATDKRKSAVFGRFGNCQATALVPCRKLSISKTPMGPFQRMVFDLFITLQNCSLAFGPISRPIHPSGILLLGEVEVCACASNLSAMIESAGQMYAYSFLFGLL